MGSCLSTDSRSAIPGSANSPARRVKKRKSSKKRLGSCGSSFDYRREEPLHRIPRRMFLNGSSEVASLFTQQGRKGTNQDAMIVWENFGSRSDTIFCGVFDGHGPFGHMVAKRVRDSLPLKVKAQWEFNDATEEAVGELSADPNGGTNRDGDGGAASRLSVDVAESEKPKENFQTLKESFLKASKAMDRELRMHPSIDCFCSGSTAVTLVKQVLSDDFYPDLLMALMVCSSGCHRFWLSFFALKGQHLVVGNVGDSRAVMATRDEDDTLVAIQLTVDLKPNLPGEEERIRSCKGRVFALEDEPEVARVWLPNSNSPGLAMARAFGDFCLKDFGLISVPEITCRRLTEKDEFVVMATDGIWDVLSNSEVVDIVASAKSRSIAARALVEAAVRGWRCKYPTSKVDDCAAVCLFLDSNSNDPSTALNAKSEDCVSSEVRICNVDPAIDEDLSRLTDLNRSGTVRTVKDILGEEEEEDDEENLAGTRQWSALEGVSRVNSLLTLPRFVPSKMETAQ